MEVWAGRGAQVLPEAQVPVPAHPLVLAPLRDEPELPALVPPVQVQVLAWSQVVGLAHLLVPPVLAGLPVLAHLVVERADSVQQLPLNRPSFSAARARSSP